MVPSETFNLRGITLPFSSLAEEMNLPVVGVGDSNTVVGGVIFVRLDNVALEVADFWVFDDAGELLLQGVGYTHCVTSWTVGRRLGGSSAGKWERLYTSS